MCRACLNETQAYQTEKKHLRFLESYTALWYYEGNVRASLLRYKFYRVQSYASGYGALLSQHLAEEQFDVLTWVPVSTLRRWRRGYDQVLLLAQVVASELGVCAEQTLKKVRNTRPQSRLATAAARRANVMNVFQAVHPERFQGKRVLLLDDIITTGATASECARVLLSAGAKEVICAAVAAVRHDTKEIQ